ncbi:MAG: hypothetical protein CVU57_01955 [Deltaproteobacteria bacterium HGW-Deltaproteobacteria-15]|jgi:tetratricopeptide (TPR) repeat protein|nr:MAG: hypothetical protein CVU57_01955 [Deltaproteobacteria bacterium HGW-Deltaproteobacteria-15]
MDSTKSHKNLPAGFSLISYGIISLLVVLSYWPTFSGDFILDDRPLVKDNSFIRQPQSAISYLSQEDGVDRKADPEASHTGYYRPLINFTYWLDYRFWGLSAPGFRATNLILHLLNCFVFFSLASIFASDRKTALLIAMLFSVHPVHTEAVSWISSRNNILVSLFCLSSLYCYVQGFRRQKAGWILLSTILFTAGLLSKEFGLMLLPIFFLYHRCFSEKKGPLRAEMASYAPFLLVLSAYFFLRMSVIGSLTGPSDGTDLWHRLYFSPYLLMMNLRYFLFPSGLHGFILGYPGSFLDWRALAGFACLGSYGVLLWKYRRNRILVFGATSFLIALFPVLNIVKTSAVTLISMRWLYFPTGLLLLAFLDMMEDALTKARLPAKIIAACLIVYLGSYSHVLNKELWHSEDTFFRQEVLRFKNVFYLGGLAENLSQKGRRGEAEDYFKLALEYFPHEARNHINYSALLLDTGRPADALACLNRARSLNMTRHERAELYNNLGIALLSLHRDADAIENLRKAVLFAPEEPLFWANLGAAYGRMEDYENSVSALKKGLDILIDPMPLKTNLAVSYIRMQEFRKAIEILESVPVQERKNNDMLSRLLLEAREGVLLKEGGKTKQAEEDALVQEGSSTVERQK